jgi:hypothetical protein
VFAGDLKSFEEKLKVATPKKVVPKKRSLTEITAASEATPHGKQRKLK